MQELTEIDTPSQHACDSPRIERWHILEPVSARWSWLTVYVCCGQVLEELAADSGTPADLDGDRRAQRAA
jgi:hypothetical protein